MPKTTTYESWGTIAAPLPPRSYLYGLPPIAVGTPQVESLTSYITRLAAAHAVETGVLVNCELVTRIPCTKGFWAGALPTRLQPAFYVTAFPLNGMGERSRLWVPLLEQLTGVTRLDLLTCLPWAKAISLVRLIRTERAWCPFCYGAQTDDLLMNELVYDRLLWTFQVVNVCPTHRCPLQSCCPSCGRTQYVFSSKTRSGYCSRCQRWLGKTPELVERPDLEQLHVAEMVAEMLAAGPRLPPGFGLRQFRENIRRLRRNRQIHETMRRRNVKGWTKTNAPRMDSLVLLSRSQNVSILQLLTERITINPRVRSSVVYNFHVHFRIADSIVEEALQSALCKDVPPPLEEIAHAAGYRCVASLQRRYRDLCAAVSRKRCANLVRTVRPPSRSENSAAREKIQYVLSEALRDGAPVSLRSLAEKIGVNKRRLYKGFHDLRKALVARNQSLRQQLRLQRRAGIEEILRKALIAVPVPTRTEIAHRLGYKSVSALTRCFPEQSAALKLRRTLSL